MKNKWVDFKEWKAQKEWFENHPLNHPFRKYYNIDEALKSAIIDSKLEDVCVKDHGNGLYEIGKGLFTGIDGVKQFDEVMRQKTEEYGK